MDDLIVEIEGWMREDILHFVGSDVVLGDVEYVLGVPVELDQARP
jgi:hypothetical protein